MRRTVQPVINKAITVSNRFLPFLHNHLPPLLPISIQPIQGTSTTHPQPQPAAMSSAAAAITTVYASSSNAGSLLSGVGSETILGCHIVRSPPNSHELWERLRFGGKRGQPIQVTSFKKAALLMITAHTTTRPGPKIGKSIRRMTMSKIRQWFRTKSHY